MTALRLADLQYDLPPELIAQHPAEPRDAARLLVLDRTTGRIEHRVFREIGEYLAPGDCLVLNDTRVIPARFFCRRETGGRVEALFLHEEGGFWRVLLKSAGRLRTGERLSCRALRQRSTDGPEHAKIPLSHGPEAHATRHNVHDRALGADETLVLVERGERGEWLARPEPTIPAPELLAKIGRTPLPPYIRRGAGGHGEPEAADAERYQTVYAERPGAVAAPTAGLHFTPELLDRLAQGGVRRAAVTLHVGAGTFVPIKVEHLAQHRMHAEWFEVTEPAAAEMRAAKAGGGQIVAVGTTAARVLESSAQEPRASAGAAAAPGEDALLKSSGTTGGQPGWGRPGSVSAATGAGSGWTDIFLYPPYRFRNVDRLITNFHLPGTTLLALVTAFASAELIRAAYREAIAQGYRFYSYGDAMLIL